MISDETASLAGIFRVGLVGCVLFGVSLSLSAAAAPDPAAMAYAYVNKFVAGDFAGAQAMQNGQMKAAFNTDAMETAWSALNKQVGKFKKIGVKPHLTTVDNQTQIYIPCEFEAATIDLLVVIDGDQRISGFRFLPHQERADWAPPAYARPTEITESELTFGQRGWELKGTLTAPKGQGPFPVLILVHGSGPNDRDETIGPNKPFKDLAWGLASRGIAVFRYDKRTLIYGEKMVPAATTVKEEVIDDAVAAVHLLEARPEYGPIFLLGHSLGGGLLPEIARQAKNVEGLIMLAASPRPFNEIIAGQLRYLFGLDGQISPAEQAQLDSFSAQDEQLRRGALGDQEMLFGMTGLYWRSLLALDPIQGLQALGKPVLFLQGERDYQVTVDKDLAAWREKLPGSLQGSLYTFTVYPGLNHLFLPGQGPGTPEEYQKPGHVALQVIEDISVWIKAHQ